MQSGLTRRVRGSISLRLAILYSLTFSIGIVAAFFISYFQFQRNLEKSTQEILHSKSQEAAAVLSSRGLRGLSSFLSGEKIRILNAQYMIRVLNEEGETLFLKPSVQDKNFDFEGAFKKQQPPGRILGWSRLAAIDDEDMFDILTERVGEEFYLQVGRSNEDHADLLEDMIHVFAATGALFIILSGGLGIWYAQRSLAPLRGLLATIKGIEKGDLSQRVDTGHSRDEMRDLGETFNRMIARIEKLVEVMKNSLDNVAHDIRTPLTRIRIVAEDALLSKNPATATEALQDCAESATEVSDLVSQLLSISEAEAGTMALQLEKCSLKEILDGVAEVYELVAQDKEISLSVACDPELSWKLDRRRIKQAVGNLVDNAIKFSPAKSSVFLTAQIEGDNLHINVTDAGSGISEGDLSRIWDRLFRGDQSRSTKGAGLGLAIVRSIVMAHGGKTAAAVHHPKGMIFSILLPRISNPS